jgi:hypothetical protein
MNSFARMLLFQAARNASRRSRARSRNTEPIPAGAKLLGAGIVIAGVIAFGVYLNHQGHEPAHPDVTVPNYYADGPDVARRQDTRHCVNAMNTHADEVRDQCIGRSEDFYLRSLAEQDFSDGFLNDEHRQDFKARWDVCQPLADSKQSYKTLDECMSNLKFKSFDRRWNRANGEQS